MNNDLFGQLGFFALLIASSADFRDHLFDLFQQFDILSNSNSIEKRVLNGLFLNLNTFQLN